ncbi:MAG: type II secretion system F family protein [Vampirovibrionales bacterium]|nr:type II secretion system F family protein [Vampirovibrionales bacterium]
MGAFHYEAIKFADRSKISGVINATNEKEARELLREQDLVPTKLKLIKNDASAMGKKAKINPIMGLIQQVLGIGAKEKIAFTRNIGMMIRAGIPLTEALMYFENFVKNAKFKSVVARVRQDIMSGYSLSQALSRHKEVFDNVYISVTRAGEKSGELDRTMNRLTELMIKAEKLKMKIIATSVYPIVVLGIVVLVLILMFVLVIPTFVDIYTKMGVKLPLITQIMFWISEFLKNQWFISFPLLGISIFGIIKFLNTSTGKVLMDGLFLKVPVINELLTYTQNSHFVSTFYVSFSAGLPITEAIQLAVQTVQHTQIRAAFEQVNLQIQTGQRLGTALHNTGYVPDIVLLMISSGEESGDMEHMLENAFEYLEDEINHRVEVLTAMMEPLLLLFVGVIVGFVALSIYLPLFSMYDFL